MEQIDKQNQTPTHRMPWAAAIKENTIKGVFHLQ